MKRRAAASLQTAAIVLLILLALVQLFLLYCSFFTQSSAASLLSRVTGGSDSQAVLALAEDSSRMTAAALPSAVSVHTDSGRTSSMYSRTAVEAAWQKYGSLLIEALDTSGQAEAVDADAMQAALSGRSVCFLYRGALDAGVLADWFSQSAAGAAGLTASLYVLSLEEDGVALLLRTKDGFYRFATGAGSDALSAALEGSGSDGSAFVFENETLAGPDPFCLLPLDTAPALPALGRTTPAGSAFQSQVLSSLGFHTYQMNRYTGSDASTVYSENGAELRFSSSGTVTLTGAGSLGLTSGSRLSEKIDTALQLLNAMLDGQTGEGYLQLYGTETDEASGDTTILFDYWVDGTRVSLGGSHAAEVRFSGTELSSLELVPRSYTCTETQVSLLPVRTALLIAEAGSGMELTYVDETGSAEWSRITEE